MGSDHPGRFDPEVIGTFVRWLGPIVRRMWPADLRRFERLPRDGRYLIVANHSAMGIAELWSLLLAWHERFGDEQPLAGMAHPGAFLVPPVRWFLHGLGAVEATREGAAAARSAGVPLLLFPGGDYEATRPFWRAHRVDFAGRTGWVRLAREHRLAIVPMCISGSHLTLPILAGGRAISWILGTRALGVHRAPVTVLSLLGAAAASGAARAFGAPWWAAGTAAWAAAWAALALPWLPAHIGFDILDPVPTEEVAGASDEAVYERVISALQAAMDARIGERNA